MHSEGERSRVCSSGLRLSIAHLVLGRLLKAEVGEGLGGGDALLLEAREEAAVQRSFNGGRRNAQLCRLLHRPLTCSHTAMCMSCAILHMAKELVSNHDGQLLQSGFVSVEKKKQARSPAQPLRLMMTMSRWSQATKFLMHGGRNGRAQRTGALHASLVEDLVDDVALAVLVLLGQDEGCDLNQKAVQLSLRTTPPKRHRQFCAKLHLHGDTRKTPCTMQNHIRNKARF